MVAVAVVRVVSTTRVRGEPEVELVLGGEELVEAVVGGIDHRNDVVEEVGIGCAVVGVTVRDEDDVQTARPWTGEQDRYRPIASSHPCSVPTTEDRGSRFGQATAVREIGQSSIRGEHVCCGSHARGVD